jgi:phosphoglucan,water dikinase
MAVLVQEMLAPDYSFVLHSASPLGNAPGIAVSEVAPGLGETLASGTRGSAWRLATNKATGEVETLAFANFSKSLVRQGSDGAAAAAAAAAGSGRPAGLLYSSKKGGGAEGGGSGEEGVLYECSSKVMDYSRAELTVNKDARTALGRRLGALAALLEREFVGAQDVEGCLVGAEVYVVQTRPQPL